MYLLIIGMVAFAGGIYIAMENASISRKQIQANTRRAGAYAVVDAGNEELGKSANERLVQPMMERFSELAIRMSPSGKRLELQRKLRNAGVSMNPQKLLAFKGAFTIIGIVMMVVGVGGSVIPMLLFGMVVFLVGFMGADFWLNSRIRGRRDDMERALPDTLDLLTVSVEAGLGFDAAIAKVCEKMDGPLIEEFEVVAREIRVGETRRQALKNLGDRVESDDLRSFARSIIQADELGTSLGRTLKVQADDMRVHRQLAAEEKAMKAPVKMLFPTVLFIFPAMFIVILGPAILNILSVLGSV